TCLNRRGAKSNFFSVIRHFLARSQATAGLAPAQTVCWWGRIMEKPLVLIFQVFARLHLGRQTPVSPKTLRIGSCAERKCSPVISRRAESRGHKRFHHCPNPLLDGPR